MSLPEPVRSLVEWVADGVGLVHPPAGFAGASSLLIDEGDVVLVDAGLPQEIRRKFAPHVDVCLLTHCHVPHMLGAGDFSEVWAPRDEAKAMHGAQDFLSTYHVDRRDHDLVSSGIRKAGYAPSPVHKQLRAGGVLRFEKHEWHLLAAPGHSHGMLALLEPKRHILFAADLDGQHPPWYGYPTSDPSALEETAVRLAGVPVAQLLTSHAPPRTRGIKPLFRTMADAIKARDKILLDALAKPLTLDELTDLGLLWGKPKTPLARYHERVMVEKHLARLLEKDYAMARQDGRFAKIAA